MGIEVLVLEGLHEGVGLVLVEDFLVEELLNEGVGVDDDQSGAAIGENVISEIASLEVVQ